MKKYFMIFLVLMISISGVSQIFSQEKQDIPSDFFMGKWGGNISGAVVQTDYVIWPVGTYPFSIELIGYPAQLGIGPFGGGAGAFMKFEGTWPNNFTIVDTAQILFFRSPGNSNFLTLSYPVNDPAPIRDMGYYTAFVLAGFNVEQINNNLILLTSGGGDAMLWSDSWAKGELHRIYTKKDTLGKTVFINEPIITDKFTQRDIVVPNKGKVIIKPNSECKFKEDRLLEQSLGEIYSKIKPGGNYKVQAPQAVCGVRGTRFITKVKKDGTTTLTVLDGEVEFSDKEKKKTVVVKNNQRSVCLQGGLPSEPVTIEPNLILKWWE